MVGGNFDSNPGLSMASPEHVNNSHLLCLLKKNVYHRDTKPETADQSRKYSQQVPIFKSGGLNTPDLHLIPNATKFKQQKAHHRYFIHNSALALELWRLGTNTTKMLTCS